MRVKRFYHQEKVSLARVKELSRFIKKLKNFGAYIEVDEVSKDKYNVELFCPKTHIDIFGNRAIVQAKPTRMFSDARTPFAPLGTISYATRDV